MPPISADRGVDSDVPAPCRWPDRFAIGTSFACLAHCLFLPLFVAAVPALSHVLTLPEELHFYVFAVAVPISAIAISNGYRRHGLILPAVLGSIGLALLGLGALVGMRSLFETGFTAAGSVLLMAAHLRNSQLRLPSRSSRQRASPLAPTSGR